MHTHTRKHSYTHPRYTRKKRQANSLLHMYTFAPSHRLRREDSFRTQERQGHVHGALLQRQSQTGVSGMLSSSSCDLFFHSACALPSYDQYAYMRNAEQKIWEIWSSIIMYKHSMSAGRQRSDQQYATDPCHYVIACTLVLEFTHARMEYLECVHT